MNKLNNIFSKKEKVISIYFTAGYPNLDDTKKVLLELDKAGVDFIEVGMPFSDPLADGPTIQDSSKQALENGMNTQLLFDQLESIKGTVKAGLVLMGYFNPILQYGVEEFCKKCQEVGISGLIIPDLPVEIYAEEYQTIFEKYDISNIFLVTPQSTESRIQKIDKLSNSFIYAVSSNSLTGSKNEFSEAQISYFKRLGAMKLKNPLVVGFGVSNAKTYKQATQYSKGAIIGSAFIKHMKAKGLLNIDKFINEIKN